MTINREHLAGLRYALDQHLIADAATRKQTEDLIAQAQAAPEAEPVRVRVCDLGYGHAGSWCGPKVDCWLDPRSREERKAAAPQHDADHIPDTTKMVDAELVELLAEVRRRVPLPDWARARIDAKLATLSAKNEGGKE